MEFILASSNPHKVEELNALFANSKLNITTPNEKIEVVEDGTSFQENAQKKAQAYFEKFGKPSLADDSGLVIPARPDILGIQSARYAPETNDYSEKNEILLKDILSLTGEKRAAHFVCYFCFYISPEEIYFFEGRVHGEMAHEITGADGFGYDPVFLPEGQDGASMAMVGEWKMANSHRAKAVEASIKFFNGYLK
jgi:XTP/dITP diphosphohydrolase